MAKALQRTPPTSSVLRLLDVEAAARAVAPPSDCCLASAALASESESGTSRRFVKRELTLCAVTDPVFEQLLLVLRRTTETRLTASHVLRGLLRAIAPHLRSIELEAVRGGPLRLPSNSRAHEAQRDAFEQQLAHLLILGVHRDVPQR